MNADPKFTQGPWRRCGHNWVCSENGIVASVAKHPDSQMKWATREADLETEANRKLITAAPVMFHALQEIISKGLTEDSLSTAIQAVKLATEEEQSFQKAA